MQNLKYLIWLFQLFQAVFFIYLQKILISYSLLKFTDLYCSFVFCKFSIKPSVIVFSFKYRLKTFLFIHEKKKFLMLLSKYHAPRVILGYDRLKRLCKTVCTYVLYVRLCRFLRCADTFYCPQAVYEWTEVFYCSLWETEALSTIIHLPLSCLSGVKSVPWENLCHRSSEVGQAKLDFGRAEDKVT